jgi:hypothetical protein
MPPQAGPPTLLRGASGRQPSLLEPVIVEILLGLVVLLFHRSYVDQCMPLGFGGGRSHASGSHASGGPNPSPHIQKALAARKASDAKKALPEWCYRADDFLFGSDPKISAPMPRRRPGCEPNTEIMRIRQSRCGPRFRRLSVSSTSLKRRPSKSRGRNYPFKRDSLNSSSSEQRASRNACWAIQPLPRIDFAWRIRACAERRSSIASQVKAPCR